VHVAHSRLKAAAVDPVGVDCASRTTYSTAPSASCHRHIGSVGLLGINWGSVHRATGASRGGPGPVDVGPAVEPGPGHRFAATRLDRAPCTIDPTHAIGHLTRSRIKTAASASGPWFNLALVVAAAGEAARQQEARHRDESQAELE
jgi:hypothetical protein